MVDSSIPEPDEWGVWVSEEADHHVPIEDGHGRLVAVHDAVLDGSGRGPVEHPRAVVLHLRLLEVEIQRHGGHGGQSVPHHGRVGAEGQTVGVVLSVHSMTSRGLRVHISIYCSNTIS